MRLPVVCSILAHIALLLVALRLPAAGISRAARTITVDITSPRPRPAEPPKPVVEPPRPELPKPAPRLRPEPLKPTQAQPREKREEAPPPSTQPPPVQAQPQPPSPPSQLSMRPSAPVDLNLHGLNGIVVNNGPVSGGEGGPAGTFGSAPRKPYKPRGDAGDPLLGKLADEKTERFPLKRESDGWHYDGPSFSAKIGTDGAVSFDDHSIRDFKGLSGGFDVTDMLMRGKKQDPYRYEKEKFMEHTSKMRADLQQKARKAQLESSLAYLPSHLEEVWADINQTPRERRRVLYAMWREAAGSDDEVGAAGRKARSTIEAFIRERLPEGSTDAFTDEELRRYNARGGAMRFEPYKQ